MNRSDLRQAFLHTHGWGDAKQAPLKGDASFRSYTRLARGAESAMLMDAPPDKEDVRPYVAVAKLLQDYSVPKIFAADETHGFLLLEDIGDDTFTRVLKADPAKEMALYEAAVDWLIEMGEQLGKVDLPPYDMTLLMREIEVCADWYLPAALGEDGKKLKDEFMQLWRETLAAHPLAHAVPVHRDYHADNLMWLPARNGAARVGILDFQDAVLGHAAYDMVSLLEDARRDLGAGVADAMLARYVEKTGVDAEGFAAAYALLGAQRNTKILGIFARKWLRDGAPQYLELLPRVWGHLARDLAHPELKRVQDWMERNVPVSRRLVTAKAH